LYELTLLARGGTGFEDAERDGWVVAALRPLGAALHPLPPGHSFLEEQDALAHYALPGWEQKRGLSRYSTFEHPDGRSKSSEETKCNSGRTETEWDAANTQGLTRGGGKASKPGGKRPNKSRGTVVICCPHRVIYGFHVMLRGESPRDVFAVLYTRHLRDHLPKYLVYDNACALRNYSMRREPAFFAEVTFTDVR
jgi:hypothetical protein